MARFGRKKRKLSRDGIVAVEMALLLPLLLILSFALIEYGWMFLKAQQITNAARQGARIGATPDATTAEVQTAIDNMMNAGSMGTSGYAVSISPAVEGLSPGETLTVTVSVPYGNVGLMNLPMIPVPGNLQSHTRMTKEGP